MTEKLTDEQKKRIYCVKHGHSPIKDFCFGYVSCARCNEQVGDTLCSVYNADDDVMPNHIGQDIEGCNCAENAKKLTKNDKKYIKPETLEEIEKAINKAKGE